MSLRPATLVLTLTVLMTPVASRTAAAQPYDAIHHRAVATFCGWDLDRYCGRAAAGHAGDLVCLARHAESLSPPCYRALRFAAAVDGCAGDYQRYCANGPPGGGRVVACLRGNADRLSATCVRALRGPAPRSGIARRDYGDRDDPADEPGPGPDDPIK